VTVPWLLFEIDASVFAIPLGAVAEICAASRPCLVPQVPLQVGGVLNLRGEPLPVLEGSQLLELEPGARYQHALVIEQDGARIGVLVGQVSRIDSKFKPGAPAEDPGADDPSAPRLVRRVHSEHGIVGLVEPAALFERAACLLAPRPVVLGGEGQCSTAF
jgi:purine-binding chemotaxis protein CheW